MLSIPYHSGNFWEILNFLIANKQLKSVRTMDAYRCSTIIVWMYFHFFSYLIWQICFLKTRNTEVSFIVLIALLVMSHMRELLSGRKKRWKDSRLGPMKTRIRLLCKWWRKVQYEKKRSNHRWCYESKFSDLFEFWFSVPIFVQKSFCWFVY